MMMKSAAITPYSQLCPINATPRNERYGVNLGASNPLRLLLHEDCGAKRKGSQEAK